MGEGLCLIFPCNERSEVGRRHWASAAQPGMGPLCVTQPTVEDDRSRDPSALFLLEGSLVLGVGKGRDTVL